MKKPIKEKRVKQADESTLNGFSIMSLEEFVDSELSESKTDARGSMFDEIIETKIAPDGRVAVRKEETIMAKTQVRYVCKQFTASNEHNKSIILDINDKVVIPYPLPDSGEVAFTRVKTEEELTCEAHILRSCTRVKPIKPPKTTLSPIERAHTCKMNGCGHRIESHNTPNGACSFVDKNTGAKCDCQKFKL